MSRDLPVGLPARWRRAFLRGLSHIARQPGRRHNLTVAQLGALIDEHVRAGRLTRCVAGYAVGGEARFGAVWR
ncbi:MAG: hypothetical protein ACK6DP_02995 [Gemmatimonas sp.]|uniref:hypothetical protein n=1 Tax=Gemmatimonas sp. TaxID=1962908 RepID=UPI00391F1909